MNMIVGNEKLFGGKRPYHTCLHSLIGKQAAQTPDATAVVFGDEKLSFAELDQLSARYAQDLYSLGIGPDSIVAVLQDRSLELVVSLLGILKAGAAYLPLDPTHPSTRLQFVLEDADVSVVLTQTSYERCIPDFLGTVRCVDAPEVWLPESVDTEQLSAVASETQPEDLAYVIYTSGSTGQPKGCMLPHQAICNRLQWMQSEYSIGHGDHVLQKTPYTFDVSVWEFFWPLITGSTIVMADPGAHKDNNYLIRTIQDQAVNVCHFVPSMLRFFLNAADVSKCTTLKKVFVSGEALPHELVVLFQEKLPHCELHNLYGPTEAAVDVSYWACHPREDGIVPIGKAIANIELYILDESLKQVAEGEEGELFIAGIGLARGYLNRPELTAERFIPNPFSDDANASSSAKMYRTGDLARQLPDGNIEYIGRTDFQVKLRGLRIELGEIETCLRQYAGVTEAAVLVRDEAEDPKLVAYLESVQAPESKAVRNHCKAHLPEYMVPNVVVTLPQLPVTTHGKLDRKALPWPVDASAQAQKQASVEPTKASQPPVAKETYSSNTISKTELTEKVQSYVCEVLRQETVDAEDDLFDLGATSLSLVRVVEKIQQGLGCVVPVDVFLDQPTVSGIVGYLIEQGVGTEDEAKPQEVETSVSQEQASASQFHDQISSIVTTILRRDTIALEDDFFDLGATSLSLVRVAEKIQKDMNVAVPVDVFLDNPTVQGVCEYIASQVTTSIDASIDASTNTSEARTQKEQSQELKEVITLDPIHFESKFYRHSNTAEAFASGVIPLAQFSSWIGLLQKQDREGRGRYLYPSGGGYNPVRTYLSINNNAIEGISGGSYYYDPQEHRLYRVGDVQVPTSHCHEYDQDAASQAGFAVYFIVSLDAIAPIYGDVSRPLAALESGYMLQLLQSRQSECGLGVRPLVSCDFDAIRDGFDLNPSERFVMGLVGGLTKESATNKQTLSDFLHTHEALCLPQQLGSVQLNYHSEDTYAQAQNLSKPLLEAFHDAHHQFRRFDASTQAIALPTQSFAWDDYRLRACQRDYQSDVVELGQLTRLLALSQENANQQRLYVESLAHTNLCLYVYIKPGRVEGVSGGIYRYDAKAHTLTHRGDVDESRMTMAYTPFNRQHFKRAAFCVYIVQETPTLPGVSKERTQHLSFIAAGTLGQVMMERQAEFALGLCPIGAIRFDKVSEAFGVSKDAAVVQSFTGGVYTQEIPVDRECLESDPLREVGRLRASLGKPTNNTQQDHMDIAIVGMSGVYPGAANLEEFWQNLKEGKSSFGPMNEKRQDQYYSKTHQHDVGAYLDSIDQFDNLLFHLSPFEARALDPQERILLEQTWACLEAAGYSNEALNQYSSAVGVFIGAMWNDYQSCGTASYQENEQISEFSHHASLANRISYFFDFKGPSVAVNTSCSSAMTALHLACQSIKTNECESAIVGGVNLVSHDYHRDLLQTLDLLSKKGVCTPLSSEADGWVLGEGAGCLLLRPLSSAERDGDHILGVIKGSAISHSGRVGRYAAPNAEQQKNTIDKLIQNSRLGHDDIDYVEVAAPGASLADAAEISALKKVFADSSTDVLIGSIKGNIGHLESASSISQICKVLLQFSNNQWVPSLNNQPINPLLGIDTSRLSVVDHVTPWASDLQKKRALVNVVGAAGSEAHVLLETYDNNHKDNSNGVYAIPVSAESDAQLKEIAQNLKSHLLAEGGILQDISRTMQEGRKALTHRVILLVDNVDSLGHALTRYVDGETSKIVKQCSSDAVVDSVLENDINTWLSGKDVDWSMHVDSGAKRTPLPTYPFEKNSFWLDQNDNHITDVERRASDMSVDSVKKDSNFDLSKTIDTLKQEFSSISEIPVTKLDAKKSFEEYGVGSLMIERLNHQLENRFGVLPKTLWFECRNIEAVAAYLHDKNIISYESDRDALPLASSQKEGAKVSPNTPIQRVSPQQSPVYLEDDIAIVGIAGQYPGAETIQEYENNLANGVDSISEVPSERWDNSKFFSPNEKGKPGKIYSNWGGFLKDVDKFDPLFFKISPKDAELIDPQERLFLQTAWHAFEDAGYSMKRLDACDRSVGVFVGVMYGEYQLLPSMENGLGVSGSYGSIANRVSFSMDLKGPSIAIDSMCSSSLTALHLACESIKRGECRYAVAGGVNLNLHPNKYATHSAMTMSSTSGRCKSFGEGGDGFVASEGVGAVVVKPLSDAIADGDHIYGVVKATALNHGGRTNGYTVPDPAAHAEVIGKAIKKANLDPSMVSLIEAHGTGTSLGDPIEIEGLTKVFGKSERRSKCAISSAKSNIGHCESAAGVAGITKVLLQMKRKQLFPSLHSASLNPNIDFPSVPFVVQQELSDWDKPVVNNDSGVLSEAPRIAGISSFGAGGSNAHVILQEYDHPEVHCSEPSAAEQNYIIPLSGRTRNDVVRYVQDLKAYVEAVDTSLESIAYTLQVGRTSLQYRFACVCNSVNSLVDQLEKFIEGESDTHYETQDNTSNSSYVWEDEDFEFLLNQWISKQKYDRLAEMWVQGGDIEWSRLYKKESPRIVSLPGYPFDKKRCWVNSPGKAPVSLETAAVGVGQITSLLHRNTSKFGEQSYLSHFDAKGIFSNHIVGGRVVIPVATYFELVISGVSEALSDVSEKSFSFDQTKFHKPIMVGHDGVSVATKLVQDTQSKVSFSIQGGENGEGGEKDSSSVYSRGTVLVTSNSRPEVIDYHGLIKSASSISPQNFYRKFNEVGISYGPSFRSVAKLWLDDSGKQKRVIAQLSKAEVNAASGLTLHPFILDAVFQVSMGFAMFEDTKIGQSLPISIDKFTCHSSIPNEAWVIATLQNSDTSQNTGSGVVSYNFDVVDTNGRVCVKVEGFNVLSKPLGRTQNIQYLPNTDEVNNEESKIVGETLLWQPIRKQSSLSFVSAPVPTVVVGNSNDAEKYFEGNIPSCISSNEIAPVLEEGSNNPLRVVWLSGAESRKSDDLIDELNHLRSFVSKLRTTTYRGVELIVMTKNGVVLEHEPVSPSASAINAFVKTLSNEEKNTHILCIDLGENDVTSLEALQRLSLTDNRGLLVLRSELVLEPVFDSFELPPVREADNKLKKGGVYLVVGGAGNVGTVFSRHLIEEHEANVVWCGRRALDAAIEKAIERSTVGQAKPEYVSVDATNPQEFNQLLQRLINKYGQVNGVFCATMSPMRSTVVDSGLESFNVSLQSKVNTCTTIVDACDENQIDFVVLFSSIQSHEALPLSSTYAAGCAYEQSIVAQLNTDHTAVRVVNWGYWEHNELNAGARTWLTNSGYQTITPKAASRVCSALLAAPITSLFYSNKQTKHGVLPTLSFDRVRASAFIDNNDASSVFEGFDHALFDSFREDIQNFICGQTCLVLQGFGLSQNREVSFDQWFSLSGINDKYLRWAEYSLDMLAKTGFISCVDGNSYCLKACHIDFAKQKVAQWQSKSGQYMEVEGLVAQIRLIDKVLEVLPGILSGEREATHIIFPNGSMELVEGIYKDSPVVDFYNEIVVRNVVEEVRQRIAANLGRKIKILEVGAGTGGTSKKVFEALASFTPNIAQYTYTDISQAFLDHAQNNYSKIAPYLTTQILNIEDDLSQQNVVLGDYDIVLATNVLHATSDMKNTMDHVKQLLQPGGAVYINEITDTNAFLHLTFGLLEGWWLYSDEYLREFGSPTLSSNAWRSLLKGLGYQRFEHSSGIADKYGQRIYSVRNNAVSFTTLDADRTELGKAADKVLAPMAQKPTSEKINQGQGKPEDIENIVLSTLAETLKLSIKDIDTDESFSNLGLDSISGLTFIEGLNTRLNSDIEVAAIYDYPKISAFVSSLDDIVVLTPTRRTPKLDMSDDAELGSSKVKEQDEQEAQKAQTEQAEISFSSLSNRLKSVVSNIIGVDKSEISDNCAFSDLGIDSISGQRFVDEINASYGLTLDAQIIYEFSTVQALVEFLRGQNIQECSTVTRHADIASESLEDINHLSGYTEADEFKPSEHPSIVDKPTTAKNSDIAIIGMSGRFASSDNVDDFWEALCQGKELIRDVDRWNLDENIRCRRGGLLRDITSFDHDFFGIPKSEADYMDPQQRIFLEEAWHALEDSCYAGDKIEGEACGVFVGHNVSDYASLLDESAPANAMWGNATSILPARISYFLNLKGPAVTTDSACSSALTSIHLACQSLRAGECQIALAGGIFIQSTENFYAMANKAGMLSASGKPNALGENADGFIPAEGVGVFVLKNLGDAVRDNDHIYGVVKGSAINQDGASNGITAPNAIAQEDLIKSCYEKSDLNMSDVSFIEAHGTSTTLGDAIEVRALNRTLAEGNTPCVIGLSKNNIGHSTAASGAASVIKILKSFQEGIIPGNIGSQKLSGQIKIDGTRFSLPSDSIAWDDLSGRRVAATSAFGMSGTNAHLVLENAVQQEITTDNLPDYLFVFSARSNEPLRRIVESVLAHIEKTNQPISLSDMSYSLLSGRRHFKRRLAVCANSIDTLKSLLQQWLHNERSTEIVFSGESLSRISIDEDLYVRLSQSRNEQGYTYSGVLTQLARLYIQGAIPNAEDLFKGVDVKKCSLPGYAFERVRCWANDVPEDHALTVGAPATSHTKDDIFNQFLDGSISAEGAILSLEDQTELETI